jgi:transposase
MLSFSTTSAATRARPPAPSSEPRGAHLLFLPPHSPDLNPIEQVFAKLKHLARKAQPRDLEATWRKVGQLLNLFSPKECENYLVNSGYGSV